MLQYDRLIPGKILTIRIVPKSTHCSHRNMALVHSTMESRPASHPITRTAGTNMRICFISTNLLVLDSRMRITARQSYVPPIHSLLLSPSCVYRALPRKLLETSPLLCLFSLKTLVSSRAVRSTWPVNHTVYAPLLCPF